MFQTGNMFNVLKTMCYEPSQHPAHPVAVVAVTRCGVAVLHAMECLHPYLGC